MREEMTMLDWTKITIRRINSIGIAHGEPIDPDELPEVASRIEDAIIGRDEDEGEVTVGGQRYRWERG
jgi:hypothetical protein